MSYPTTAAGHVAEQLQRVLAAVNRLEQAGVEEMCTVWISQTSTVLRIEFADFKRLFKGRKAKVEYDGAPRSMVYSILEDEIRYEAIEILPQQEAREEVTL